MGVVQSVLQKTVKWSYCFLQQPITTQGGHRYLEDEEPKKDKEKEEKKEEKEEEIRRNDSLELNFI